jgi:hypothetical protein
MVPFLSSSGLHNSNAFRKHLDDITDSRRFPLSLLLGHVIIREKTIDSSSVMATAATTGNACVAGSLCKVLHLVASHTRQRCPAPDNNEPKALMLAL